MNRGSEMHDWLAEQAAEASMRPRFMNRGSGVPDIDVLLQGMLQ